MTTDEAKDYIREWCPYDKQDEIIKALSNSDYPKCNTCIHKNEDVICYGCVDNDEYVSNSDEDCISREAVIEILVNYGCTNKEGLLFKDINALPSVQPKTDVLDKIRAEIHATAEMHENGNYYLRDEWIDEIIDKYKAESEE